MLGVVVQLVLVVCNSKEEGGVDSCMLQCFVVLLVCISSSLLTCLVRMVYTGGWD